MKYDHQTWMEAYGDGEPDDFRRACCLFDVSDLPRIGRLCRAAHRRNVRCERSSIRRLPTFGSASYWYDKQRAIEETQWLAERATAEMELPF